MIAETIEPAAHGTQVSVDERLASFAIEDRHRSAFQRISDILFPHARELAILYLDGFLAAAGIALDPEERAVQNAKLSLYIESKYTPPIDAGWIARVEKMGRLQYKLGAPIHANLGAINRSHRKSAELIFAGAADDAEGRYLIEQFMRATALESEIMVSTVQDLKNQAFDARMRAGANNFRSNIAQIVANAGERSASARRKADEVADASLALLSLSSDVAVAAVQSNAAMAEAARMSGGIDQAIDAIDAELAAAFDSFDDLSATAERTVSSAGRLAQHERSIERMVKQIRDIADRTSILALNALIEAASAGAAGAGFAVVANEMKSLAAQIGAATKDISEQLSGISDASQVSVEANRSMQAKFAGLRGTAQGLRTSLAEQAGQVTAIAACIDETAHSAAGTSQSISVISERAEHVSHDIGEVTGNVAELDRSLQDLGNSARVFLAELSR